MNDSRKSQAKPAALLHPRGWEILGEEINRSSSAPPTQLRMPDNNLDVGGREANFSQDSKGAKPAALPAAFVPANNNWNLWAPPAGTAREQPQLFAPNPVKSSRGAGNWAAPSPLRTTPDLASPLRMPFREFEGNVYPTSNQPIPVQKPGYHDFDGDDEIRMKQLLRATLDSKEDLFSSPIPRAASTPPTRLQFANPRFPPAQDETYGMQNLNMSDHSNMRQARRPAASRYEGVHTTTSAHFPQEPNNLAYSRDFEMQQMRHRAQGVYEHEAAFLARPASAQGRFASPASRPFAPQSPAPPGFDTGNNLDPAMAQAMATLSAGGNLTPEQIQQIQMQLRFNSPVAGQPAPMQRQQTQPRKDPYSRSASPTRSHQTGGHSPTSNGEGHSPTRSALLEEFRSSKNRKFELKDIIGSMVEFSGDQHGSRFIQQKLESATDADRQLVFVEVFPHAIELTTDVFGNYVIQKFFEHGSFEQKHALAENMKGKILALSLQMYGCRVVQKAFEYVGSEQQNVLIKELEGNVLKCVKDQNGNHVIQKAVERVAAAKIKFIIDAFYGQVYALATHPYGCRVIQRIFEHCSEESTDPLMDELQKYAISLIQDQYGNYVIQHILEKGKPKDKAFVISKVKGNILNMSKHKFASNVVEKCVSFGSAADRQDILDEVITTKADGTTALYTMMKDQFANYVVQKLLDLATEHQRVLLVTKIKPQLPSLKKYTYGKHLITKVEKFIIQYRID